MKKMNLPLIYKSNLIVRLKFRLIALKLCHSSDIRQIFFLISKDIKDSFYKSSVGMKWAADGAVKLTSQFERGWLIDFIAVIIVIPEH